MLRRITEEVVLLCLSLLCAAIVSAAISRYFTRQDGPLVWQTADSNFLYAVLNSAKAVNSSEETLVIKKESPGGRPKQKFNDGPRISFVRINPVLYMVKIQGARDPFWLVFSQSFHEKWLLYRQEGIRRNIFIERFKIDLRRLRFIRAFVPSYMGFLFYEALDVPHKLVNNYANGWRIDPQQLGSRSNFILMIFFWPQIFFYFGCLVSLVATATCLFYLFYRSILKGIAHVQK